MDSVMKQIKFSKRLAQQAELQASKIGVSFNEYVRHLVINDTNSYVEKASPKLVKELESSLKDIDEGRYTVLTNKEDIKNYVSSLAPTDDKRKK